MTSSPAKLPEFVVIGAAKAATTWITNQLRARDDVFMPSPEPHFFSREYDKGQAHYEKWFEEAQPGQLIGEKSADYLADPDVPERLSRMLPDAKIIVQLRNPVSRAYSDYCMYYRRGTVSGDIEHFLGSLDNSHPRFLNDGLYHKHLMKFLDFVPSSRLKVIYFDDIRTAPKDMVREVTEFLELEDDGGDIALVERANVKDAPLLPLGLRKVLQPAKGLVKPLRSHSWFKALHGSLAKEMEYPPLTDELKARLCEFYADDVEKLSGLLGEDLSHWVKMPAEAKEPAA